MAKISAKSMFFIKKLFPLLWFGVLGFFAVTVLVVDKSAAFILIVPLVMTVLGYYMMKVLIWDLVDEVYDCGDSLLAKNAGQEERIPLSSIMNVSATTLMNPQRVTLRLVKPGKLGSDVSFSPVSSFKLNPFTPNPIAEDLMVRVDQARSRRVT